MILSRSQRPGPLHKPPSLFRGIAPRAFTLLAYGATSFGLLFLIVFFVRLGADVLQWFQTMPALVATNNAALEGRIAAFRDLDALTTKEMAAIGEEMDEELKGAPSEAARERIRQDFEKFKARRRTDLLATSQEVLAEEKLLRPDTSPLGLLRFFLSAGPASEPQDAGILPALLGSLYLGLITILLAVPLGVGAAIYLEEYRSANWLARVIQININNLAGVPSVMYGILGAYVFVELIFKRVESESIAARNLLGGGCTLALLTLPVIIVSAQESIRAVPSSLRHAAFALGATRWQVVWRVVLPSAIPGTMTGIILALCRALGEAAPLVLFGALLYVNHNPTLFGRFTALPLQIFGWSDRPVEAWRLNAAVASAILVLTLLILNGTAIYLRQRAQRHVKW